MLLEGKVALITGAASGIGRATAMLFAREGAKLAVVDINASGCQETVDRICDASGEAIAIPADVGRMNEVQAMVETAFMRFGKLDIVHSNAAAHVMGSAIEINEHDWDRTLDVCLKATWMLAHCTLPRIVAQGGGVFVITGSVHALRGYARYAPYQAAKGGLLALTRSLAADFAPTVRVNTILPGAVVTGLWDNVSEEDRRKIAEMCPLKRNGQPEEIAQAALFLASDMSSYMTGEYLIVDGGLTSIIQVATQK
jgi:NAD(P)-dependent dehydrogenase (short-subunit alcohol dehydrogenase family)